MLKTDFSENGATQKVRLPKIFNDVSFDVNTYITDDVL